MEVFSNPVLITKRYFDNANPYYWSVSNPWKMTRTGTPPVFSTSTLILTLF